jgi:hypothetical protein
MLTPKRPHGVGQIFERIEDRSAPDLVVGGNLANVLQELMVNCFQ